ncbi:hypothetical protein Golob_018886, partial [Gossypium lobatum]|nr:hypothetical protein [Gossypium lobatum]
GIGKSSADTSSVSPVPYVFNGSSRGRKCTAVEKVAERQQRRMIKNRESAARYQARKQKMESKSKQPPAVVITELRNENGSCWINMHSVQMKFLQQYKVNQCL